MNGRVVVPTGKQVFVFPFHKTAILSGAANYILLSFFIVIVAYAPFT